MEGASRVANLAATDLRKIHDAEAMAAAHSLAERLSRHMRVRLMRRERAQRHGRRVDLRRTIRRNIGSGGVPLTLVRLARKQKPVRLVVLLDVSGSMNQYTSVFVRFVHGVLCHFRGAEAFLVHTSLAHVTPALAERDAGRALDRLSLMAQGVGGGTRIGEVHRNIQQAARATRDQFPHLRNDLFGWLRHGCARASREGDAHSGATLPAHCLAQSNDRMEWLPAYGTRDAGRHAVHRFFRSSAFDREPGCARALSCSDLIGGLHHAKIDQRD